MVEITAVECNTVVGCSVVVVKCNHCRGAKCGEGVVVECSSCSGM